MKKFALACLLIFVAIVAQGMAGNVADSAGCVGRIDGNWLVSEQVTCRDRTIVLAGNLTVVANGKLFLYNSELHMECPDDGGCKIEVAGGELRLISTKVTAADETKRYAFSYRSAGGEITFSTLEHMLNGVRIQANDFVIENTTIRNSGSAGVAFHDSDNAIIRGNTFQSNSGDNILLSSSSASIYDNKISGSSGGNGVKAEQGSDAQIYRNRIYSNHRNGLECVQSSCEIFDNMGIGNNGERGISAAGTRVWIYGNTITDNADGIMAGNSPDLNIHDNAISGHSAGVAIGFSASTSATVENNALSDNDYGIYAPGAVEVEATVNGNTFMGNAIAIGVLGPSTINADNNVLTDNLRNYEIGEQSTLVVDGITMPSTATCSVGEIMCSGMCMRPRCIDNQGCDDGNYCTLDICHKDDPCTAMCSNVRMIDGAPCGQGMLCCGGSCRSICVSDYDCDDGNPLTEEYCDAANTCAAHCVTGASVGAGISLSFITALIIGSFGGLVIFRVVRKVRKS